MISVVFFYGINGGDIISVVEVSSPKASERVAYFSYILFYTHSYAAKNVCYRSFSF